MITVFIGIGIFITIVLLIQAVYFTVSSYSVSESRTIKKRLRTLSAGGAVHEEIDILKNRLLSEVPWLNSLLTRYTRSHHLDKLLEQANSNMSLGYFYLLTAFMVVLGFVSVYILRINLYMIIIIAPLLGMIPFLYLSSRRARRLKAFQEQLPDALDLMARALKAGHAFSGGLTMVAEEFADPIGPEFAKTIDEINFGIGVNEAMINLARRVSIPDLQFFTLAVIIQRETGGNLAEIFEKIAYIIRERFKLFGKVRALSAEGKYSAIILFVLPIVMAVYISIVNPSYMSLLYKDPMGFKMVCVAIGLMITGAFVMRRMINIKV